MLVVGEGEGRTENSGYWGGKRGEVKNRYQHRKCHAATMLNTNMTKDDITQYNLFFTAKRRSGESYSETGLAFKFSPPTLVNFSPGAEI